MTNHSIITIRPVTILLAVQLMTVTCLAQSDSKKEKITADANVAKQEFIKADPKIASQYIDQVFMI